MFHRLDPVNRDGQLRASELRAAAEAAAAASVLSAGQDSGYFSPIGQVLASSDPVNPNQPVFVQVRNSTGVAQGAFSVLGLNGPVTLPSSNLAVFEAGIVFDGITPTVALHTGHFAVIQQQLAAGATGLAVVAGATIAQLNVPSGAAKAYADVKDSDTSQLLHADTGSAQVLWADSSGTTRWAIVRLSNSPLAGGAITVKNIDGSSTTVNNVTTLQFDFGFGLLVSTPGAGIATVSSIPATELVYGTVTTTTQNFAGMKTFWEQINVGHSNNAANCLHLWGDSSGGIANWGSTSTGPAIKLYSSPLIAFYPAGLSGIANVSVGSGTDTAGLGFTGDSSGDLGSVTFGPGTGTITLATQSGAAFAVTGSTSATVLKVDGTSGVSGTFTFGTKTVTVKGGIITSVV